MAKLITLEVTRTYATAANAQKAFEKRFGHIDLSYMVLTHTDGRFYPVCTNAEKGVLHQVHLHFHVVG